MSDQPDDAEPDGVPPGDVELGGVPSDHVERDDVPSEDAEPDGDPSNALPPGDVETTEHPDGLAADGLAADGLAADGARPHDVEGADKAAPAPFSWDAVAAELAATLEEHDEEAVAAGWGQVAAQLAADLGAPTGRPGTGVPAPGTDHGPEPTPGTDHGPDTEPAPLGRAPAAPPVELEVVPEPEAPVEEAVAADPVTDGPTAEELDPAALRGGLEALLFVVDSPIDEGSLAAALGCPVPRVRAELTALAADYDGRRAGVTLRRVG
ncbi:hypothetical protein [Modestobacter marinus]|nr:hypothetical protein [Modestobacter marinus]